MPYTVAMIPGVPSNSRRGIAFLESDDDCRIDGKEVFDGCKEKTRRDLLARFDHWLSGQTGDHYFHGWPNDTDHKYCFVFKWKQAGTNHRLYGFICNPRQPTDPRFQACILVLHARKNTSDTDPSLLGLVNSVREQPEVLKSIVSAFAISDISHAKRTTLDRRKR
jgi:hypothetical protein